MIELKPAQHIFYRNEDHIEDLEFIVLEKYVEYCYCISAAPLKDEMPFDINNNNEWKTSSLRKYLNEEYILRFNRGDIKRTNDGQIFLLSKEETMVYKDILPKYPTFWWTRTTCDSYAHHIWIASVYGRLFYCPAFHNRGVAPVCVFNLRNLSIFPERNNIIFESKN